MAVEPSIDAMSHGAHGASSKLVDEESRSSDTAAANVTMKMTPNPTRAVVLIRLCAGSFVTRCPRRSVFGRSITEGCLWVCRLTGLCLISTSWHSDHRGGIGDHPYLTSHNGAAASRDILGAARNWPLSLEIENQCVSRTDASG